MQNQHSLLYFDTSSVGLVSKSVRDESLKYNTLLATDSSGVFYNFLAEDLPILRNSMRTFLNVNSGETAFVPNFSYGFAAVVASIGKLRKNVLLLESDYPSLSFPFVLNNFNITWQKSENAFSWSLSSIEAEIIKNQIQILAISHVQYLTGFTSDLNALADICKRLDVVFLVDASQSLGAIPIDFENTGIDVLIASNYKWMNAGFGSAFVCFQEGFLQKFNPVIAGYTSVTFENGNMNYQISATNYEPGHFGVDALLMLKKSVQEKMNLGIENIHAQNMKMAQHFVNGLDKEKHKLIGSTSFENRCSMICIQATHQLHEEMLKKHFKAMYRNNSIRFAFHTNNTIAQVDELLKFLNEK